MHSMYNCARRDQNVNIIFPEFLSVRLEPALLVLSILYPRNVARPNDTCCEVNLDCKPDETLMSQPKWRNFG